MTWKTNHKLRLINFTLAIITACAISVASVPLIAHAAPTTTVSAEFDLSAVPEFDGTSPFVIIDNNVPTFTAADLTTESFESYSELDALGRCGTAYANIGTDLMPTEERGSIGMIKPSGWHTIKYDNIADRYLYNRCHLIGYQLAGENANERNLITGTRYLNVTGMLPCENQVAEYVQSTGNHVLYRVTPIFVGDELVARGVHMEAKSVEDNGAGVSFNIFCYNAQPGITIDYATGDSQYVGADEGKDASKPPATSQYVANKNTKKFHYSYCDSVSDMKEKNKLYFDGNRQELINKGYVPCKRCNP